MKKIAIAFFTLSLLTIPNYGLAIDPLPAQSKCSLMETNSPGIRGLRLGMSLEQLLAAFPGSSKRREMKDAIERAKTAGSGEVVQLAFDPATDAGGDRFAGIDYVSAGIYKGRVADFYVIYVGPTWRSIDEWVTKLSEIFNLPNPQEWMAGSNENPNRILKCGGIEIEAAVQGGGASIRVRNTESMGAQEQTRGEEERRRRAFKP
ncbi:MAG: hypothetical protein V7641_5054 [Blastocatellia bacterium]